jgi:hypothetical protein
MWVRWASCVALAATPLTPYAARGVAAALSPDEGGGRLVLRKTVEHVLELLQHPSLEDNRTRVRNRGDKRPKWRGAGRCTWRSGRRMMCSGQYCSLKSQMLLPFRSTAVVSRVRGSMRVSERRKTRTRSRLGTSTTTQSKRPAGRTSKEELFLQGQTITFLWWDGYAPLPEEPSARSRSLRHSMNSSLLVALATCPPSVSAAQGGQFEK